MKLLKVKKVFYVAGITLMCLACNLQTARTSKAEASSRINIAKIRRQCSTRAKAMKHMTTIKVKVWDFAHGRKGKKVTKIKYVTVNKAVAKQFKKSFQEIYEGEDKFPIYEIGGFEWRGKKSSSLHNLGLSVDINANENCMIVKGKVVAGSYWKPGKDPYSIPKNGDVAQAMKKRGLKQCLWSHTKDYMHFSVGGY